LNMTATTVAGASYSWTGPNGFTSVLQNPSISNVTVSASGVYSVYSIVSGCTSLVNTTTVVVNAIPASPTAGSNSPVCAGSTLNMTATTVAGASYSWTGPNGFTSVLQNPSISNATVAASGVYSVYSVVSGCTSLVNTTTVVVNAIPASPTSGSNSPVCAGSTLNMTATTVAGASYSWTGPNGFTSVLQNPSISNATASASGVYSVYSVVSGCTSLVNTTTVVVNAIPASPTSGSNSPVCAGNTLNMTATTVAGASYSWTGPNGFTSVLQNPSISNATASASGVYSVYSVVSGCTSLVNTTTVSIGTPPILSITNQTNPTCFGSNDGSITTSASGGIPPYTYSLDGVTYQNTTGIFTGIPAGNSIVYVRDSIGCQSQATFTITEPQGITAQVDSLSNPTCFGLSNGNIYVSALGGSGAFQYIYHGNTNTTGFFQNLSAGSDTVLIIDQKGCQFSLPFTLTQPNQLVARFDSVAMVSCNGANDGKATVIVSGGTPPYLLGVDSTNLAADTTFSNIQPGNLSIYVLDSHGCSTTITTAITEPPVLDLTLNSIRNVLCTGAVNGEVQMNSVGGTPPYQYSINYGNFFPNNGLYTDLDTGSYVVQVKDKNGCLDSISFSITQPAALEATIALLPASCRENNGVATLTTLGGTPPYRYIWQGNAATTSTANDYSAGNYTVQVLDSNNCSITIPFEIERINPPTAQFSTNTNIGVIEGYTEFPIENAVLTTTNESVGDSLLYFWDFGDGNTATDENPTHRYSQVGDYQVTLQVMDYRGCTDTIVKSRIHVVSFRTQNVFTPNGDGVNDTWLPITASDIVEMTIVVSDRWGNTVFESNSMTNPWKGDLNGNPIPTGVYYFNIKYKTEKGVEVKRSGSVTLLR
ncbi:MAG: gliding motility-associated C-terminal domain-containing protein, partial [Bacteroidia bacterium]|nr:gliding motility-associated C-terminal domain-containing protein [Bacteroidia bacterium]